MCAAKNWNPSAKAHPQMSIWSQTFHSLFQTQQDDAAKEDSFFRMIEDLCSMGISMGSSTTEDIEASSPSQDLLPFQDNPPAASAPPDSQTSIGTFDLLIEQVEDNADFGFDFLSNDEIEFLRRFDQSQPDFMDIFSHSQDSQDNDDSVQPVCVTPSPKKANTIIDVRTFDRRCSVSSIATSCTEDSDYSTETDESASIESVPQIKAPPKIRRAARNVGGGRKKPKRIRKFDPLVKRYVGYTDRDVLLGRGGQTNKHAGNIVYRRRILEDQPKYKTLTSIQKTRFSESVVKWIQQDRKGRFLEKERTGRWFIVEDDTARKKVSQALREDHTPAGRAAKRSRTKP